MRIYLNLLWFTRPTDKRQGGRGEEGRGRKVVVMQGLLRFAKFSHICCYPSYPLLLSSPPPPPLFATSAPPTRPVQTVRVCVHQRSFAVVAVLASVTVIIESIRACGHARVCALPLFFLIQCGRYSVGLFTVPVVGSTLNTETFERSSFFVLFRFCRAGFWTGISRGRCG